MHGLPSKKLTRDDLLLAEANKVGGTSEPASPDPRQHAGAAVVRAGGASCSASPPSPSCAARLPVPGVYGLAKVLGVLLFAYVPWLVVSFGQAAFTRGTLAVTFGLLLAWGALAWRRGRGDEPSGEWAPTELLFWGTFLLFLARARLQPGDLLGREADGLLVPQRAVARHHPAAAGAVVLRLDAALHLLRPLHRRRARQAVQHPSRADLQPRHRALRRADRQRRLRARRGDRRPAQRRPALRHLRRPDRQPRRPARAAVAATWSTSTTSGPRRGSSRTPSTSTRSGASCSPTCTRT